MAIDADKDLKNFIQDHLVLLVRGQKKEQKTFTNVKLTTISTNPFGQKLKKKLLLGGKMKKLNAR